MTPDHQAGRAAAKAVMDANTQGTLPDVHDCLCMLTYHLSLELRRLSPQTRLEAALKATRAVIANTRESLD